MKKFDELILAIYVFSQEHEILELFVLYNFFQLWKQESWAKFWPVLRRLHWEIDLSPDQPPLYHGRLGCQATMVKESNVSQYG